MRRLGILIVPLIALVLAACASPPPRYRGEALASLGRVRSEGGDTLRPAEYRSALKAYLQGESLLKAREEEDAERYYQLALLKGTLLRDEVREQKARQREAERLALELKKAEEERQAQEEAARLAQARAEAQAQREANEASRKKTTRPQREHPLVSSYTVTRGESLPLIASRPEVYGDRNLWPLIYRANRDQISDPRHIWPGQVLRIPRNLGREDMVEARRYSQERPLH